MCKINLVQGADALSVASSVLKKVTQTNICEKNIVIVPSGALKSFCRNFLVKEKQVIFSTSVETVREFFDKFLGLKKTTDFEKNILVRKAMNSCQGRLKALGGEITNGMVKQVSVEINRFEEACLSVEDLLYLRPQQEFLRDKVQDLAVIYKEYLCLSEMFDSKTLESMVKSRAKELQYYNFFFVGFENLLGQDLKALKFLAQNAKDVYLGALKGENAGNSYIFEDVISQVQNLQNQGIEIVLSPAPNLLSEKQEKIKKLAFSVQSEKEDLDFLRVLEAEDLSEEVEFLARQIKKLLYSRQAKQSEIGVICGNLSAYTQQIENVFSDYGFSFSVSQNKSAENNHFANFVKDVFGYILNPKADKFSTLTANQLAGCGSETIQFLKDFFVKNGPKDITLTDLKLFNFQSSIKTDLEVFINKILQIKNQESFFDKLREIIQIFDLKNKALNEATTLKSGGYLISEESLFVVSRLEEFLNFQELFIGLTESEKFLVFKDWLGNLSYPKQNFDYECIEVTSAGAWTSPKKFLFVLGANHGQMPSVGADSQILTDADLNSLGLNVETVLTQNRLARQRVYNSLLGFKEGLVISYSLKDQGGQKLLSSGFVGTIIESAKNQVFGVASKSASQEMLNLTLQEKANVFVGMTGTRSQAKKEYIRLSKGNNDEYLDIMSTIKFVVGESGYKKDELSAVNLKELFFNQNKTTLSQIEIYYSCPFKHFMSYGLKLSEPLSFKFQSVDTGNILHKVAEKFVGKMKQSELIDVETEVERIFEGLKEETRLQKVFLPQNKIPLQVLKNESVRLCEYLLDTDKKTNFKPKFLEFRFGDKQKFTLKVLDEDFSLVGVVDRVDVYKNNAVIIDYKTGSGASGSKDELFYGEKIQIFVYAKALESLMGLNPQGVFYFPITNRFYDYADKLYMLKGKNVYKEDFLQNFDKTLTYDNPKSTIFPCYIKTSETIRKQGIIEYSDRAGNHVMLEEFQNMLNYSISLVKQAIEEILGLNVAVSPKKGACTYCPYASICQKDGQTVMREECFDVTKINFNFEGGENE